MRLHSTSLNLGHPMTMPARRPSVPAFSWTKFTHDYASETTLHGIRELNEAPSAIWKIVWGAALVICVILSAYLIATGIMHYLATPVATTIGVSPVANFQLPMLYCPNRWLHTEKILALKLTPDVLVYALSFICGLTQNPNDFIFLDSVFPEARPPYITPENLTTTERNLKLLLEANNFQNAFDLLLAISVDSNSLIIQSDLKSFSDYATFEVHPDKVIPATKVVTGSGVCFRATLPVDENIIDAFQRNKLDLLPTISEQQFSLQYYEQPSYISVETRHGVLDLLFLGDQAAAFIPDSTHALAIFGTSKTYRISGITNYSRVDRKDQPCRDRSIQGGPYFEQECKQECYTRAKRGCQPLGLNVRYKTNNLCRFGAPKQQENGKAFLDCLASCPIPCQETTAKIEPYITDESRVPSDPLPARSSSFQVENLNWNVGPPAPSDEPLQDSVITPLPDFPQNNFQRNWPNPECTEVNEFPFYLSMLLPESCLTKDVSSSDWCAQILSEGTGMFFPKPCLNRILNDWKLPNLTIHSWPYETVADRLQYPISEDGHLSEFLGDHFNSQAIISQSLMSFYHYLAYYAANYPLTCTWSDLMAIYASSNTHDCDSPNTWPELRNQSKRCIVHLKNLLNVKYLTQECATDLSKKWTNDSSESESESWALEAGFNNSAIGVPNRLPDSAVKIVVSRTVTSFTEDETYTWDALLGIVGGQLGLWLGGSLLSMFQLVYYLFLGFHRRQQDPREV